MGENSSKINYSELDRVTMEAIRTVEAAAARARPGVGYRVAVVVGFSSSAPGASDGHVAILTNASDDEASQMLRNAADTVLNPDGTREVM